MFLLSLVMYTSILQTANDDWADSTILAPAIISTVVFTGALLSYCCRKKRMPDIPPTERHPEPHIEIDPSGPAKNLFRMETSSISHVLKKFPEIIEFKDHQQRNLLHHAMLRHYIPLLTVLLKHPQADTLLKQIDIQRNSPRSLISLQRNNKSLLESAYDADAHDICKMLITLGAGDYGQTSNLFSKRSIESYAQQKVCLHELRIRQNFQGGCLICMDEIQTVNVTLHDCCYTCFHRACSLKAREHNSRCPKCRSQFGTITEKTFNEQTEFAQGLQDFFN